MRRLVQISTNDDDLFHASKSWIAQAYGSCLCEECHGVDRTRFPEPIDVVLAEYSQSCIGASPWWTGIEVFDRAFLAQLGEHLSGFVVGRCLDDGGNIIEKYATCYTAHYIIERGNRNSRYWICGTCGSISPDGWYGKQYTLAEYLDDRLVYQDASGTMYIDEELALELDFSPWPDADLTTIPVRDKPIDGKDLPWVSPDRSFRKNDTKRI